MRTVSYTHLDVYKRQGYTVAVAKGQVAARLIRIHGLEHLLLVPHKAVQLVLHVLLCLLAVDVYKRQA